MTKKIFISTLLIILLTALLVGLYDLARGASSMQFPAGSRQATPIGKAALAQPTPSGTSTANQPVVNEATPNRQTGSQPVANEVTSNGQGGNQPTGGLALTPNDWFTMTGQVSNVGRNGLTVQTHERGQVTLQLGRPGFAAQQGVNFNVGDTLTILAFDSPEGLIQAGEVTNNTTQQVLYLRDPNGRPLWAGQGGGGGGKGQGKN